jgi:hypothetical protein
MRNTLMNEVAWHLRKRGAVRKIVTLAVGAGYFAYYCWRDYQQSRGAADRAESKIDEALEETFPASDPPAFVGGNR